MENDSELQKLQGEGKKISVISAKEPHNKHKPKKPLGERGKAVLRQQVMVLLGNSGVMGGGMAVALPSVTLGQLTNPSEAFSLDPDEASWYSSINSMACPLGGVLVGYLLDKLGRKKTILVTNLVGVLGWLLIATSSFYKTRDAIYAQILIGRFISGIMIGLCVSPVGVYSAEISLPRIRGRLILCTSMGIAAGILFMYVIGYFIRNDFQLIAAISCVYQIFATICVLPMPETPSWLMQRGLTEKARKSLKYFRGIQKNDIGYYEEFEEEFAQLKKSTEISRNTAAKENSLITTIKAPEVYKPIILMIAFFAFQQLSGVVVVVVFAVQIATQAGVTADPFLVAVFVGIARIITTLFMGGIFEKFGRKPAGVVSASGMAVCMFLLALYGWVPAVAQSLPLLSIVCIVLFIIFSTMGLLTLPFFMISEVFPQRVRGAASGTSVSVGLLISFMVVKLYPGMEATLGISAVFSFFGGVSLLAAFFITYCLPETRGRTLLEIEDYFRTGKMPTDIEIVLRRMSSKTENCAELGIPLKS